MGKLEGKIALITGGNSGRRDYRGCISESTGLAYLDMKSWGDKIADIINSATERPIGRITLSTAGISDEC